jgi:hypothetical protein
VMTVMCWESKQNAAMPSPQTTAPTSAPLPGTQDSVTREIAILSHPSAFSMRTSRLASMSRVWNAPILTWSFSEVTGPDICRDAVGGGAVEEEAADVAVAFDKSVGAEEAEKSTRETCTVRFRRIRWDSVEPVDDTF